MFSLNINQMVGRACEEPTLLDALTLAAIWESERIVIQARKHEQWETCFRATFQKVMKAYVSKKEFEATTNNQKEN
jgi:hypothetical protein